MAPMEEVSRGPFTSSPGEHADLSLGRFIDEAACPWETRSNVTSCDESRPPDVTYSLSDGGSRWRKIKRWNASWKKKSRIFEEAVRFVVYLFFYLKEGRSLEVEEREMLPIRVNIALCPPTFLTDGRRVPIGVCSGCEDQIHFQSHKKHIQILLELEQICVVLISPIEVC